jgi:hypothetical protein
MSHSGHVSTDEAQRCDRRWKAWDLRVRGYTIRAIAEQLQVTIPTIESDLREAKKAMSTDAKVYAAEHRLLHVERNEQLYYQLVAEVIPTATKDYFDPENRKAYRDPKLLQIRTNAIVAASKVLESTAKLLGLNAPIEITADTPTISVDLSTLSDEELKQLYADTFR